MSRKYPICDECYFQNRAPEICEECDEGSEFEPNDEEDSLPKLKAVKFQPPRKWAKEAA